jgi:hypothetical protein
MILGRNAFKGIAYVVLFSLLSCREHEFTAQELPRVETSAVTGISETGVTLQAIIWSSGKHSFTDHGFIWGVHPNLHPETSSKISLGALSAAKAFETQIERDLINDTTYYVKAFMATNARVVYGQIVSFKTAGKVDVHSGAPVIDSFSPERGTFGDVITIYGSNFSSIGMDNHVQFNEFAARVTEASDSVLTVMVPMGLTAKDHTVAVTVNSQRAESTSIFEMLPPVIESVFPTSGPLGTTVTIQGANFTTDFRANDVMFGNMNARLLSASKNELKVRITRGIYDSRNPEIRVKVAGQTVTAQQAFHVEDAWMEKNTAAGNGIDFGTAFVIGDHGYAGLGGPGSRTFYKYSVTANSWTEIAEFPGKGRDHATSFVLDGRAYAGGGGTDPQRSDFYRYDPSFDRWEAIADFPFGISGAVGLARKGKGYVLARDPNDNVSRLWAYDPASDKWQTVSSNETDLVADAGFVSGDRLYIFAFDPQGGYHQLLEFDFRTSAWVRRGNRVTGAGRYGSAFVLGGKGYVIAGGSLMEYNLSGETWKTLAGDHPSAREGAFAFAIGDQAYFGFGHSGDSRFKDFWELYPEG